MSSDSIAQLVYLGLLAVAVGGWVMVEYRTRLGVALRTAMAWAMIFLGVIAGYGLWSDIKTDIIPQQMVTGGQIEVPRAQDGHYYLTLMINKEPVRFMADTGATNMVLSESDARRLGLDPSSLMYLGQASTANGTVRSAEVTLPTVELGPYSDTDFRASVTEGLMDISLLGMDYLGRYRIEIADGKMILRR